MPDRLPGLVGAVFDYGGSAADRWNELRPSVGAAMYRLAQESITNALRHARNATRIDVCVAVYMLGELIGSVVPPERRNRLVGLLIVMTATGKLVIVGQTLQPSFLIGSALGVVTLPAFRRLARFRVPVLLSLLFAIYTARSVLPLELRDAPADISWIPFASLLNGEMDINAASLGNAIYFFAGMVWLVARMHGRVMPVTIALACWVTLIEFAQRWLDGHGADTTPPLLALAAGLAIRLAGVPHEPASGTPSPTAPTRGDASAPRAAVLATRHDR